MNKGRFYSLLLILGLLLSCSSAPTRDQKVLLLSFDGFRADYLTKTETPNFDRLISDGVTSEGLIPIFPSKTFPNYYAIATGLYPENNKLISNRMYDPEMDLYFSMGDREQVENPKWYGGEPIWNTVEKEGKNAGAMFWVGSEAPVQNMRPTFWKSYDGRMDNFARIDTVVKWMTLNNDQEVDFSTLYFSFVDSQGHRYGPDSEEVIQAIQRADSLVGYLIDEFQDKGLWDMTNIIIVSDHGMAELSNERVVILDDMIDPDQIEIIEGTPSLMFNVTSGDVYEMYEKLKEGEEHYQVYTRDNIPERFHIKNSSRLPEIIMIADIGYTIYTRDYAERYPDRPSGGAHGFDNRAEEMHAIFAARGPGLKKGVTLPAFENIHIYELIAHLLEIESAGTDGNLEALKDILK